MIAELWSKVVPDRIQDVIIGNFTDVRSQEVMLSTWGGKIYLVGGTDGKRKWRSETYTYPPSNLNKLGICGENYLLASFAADLRLLKPQKEEELVKGISLNSVILDVQVADVNQDGREELVVYTKDNNLLLYDDKLNMLWKKSVSLLPSMPLLLSDVDYDNKLELLVGGNNQFRIFSDTGEEIMIEEFKEDTRLLSLVTGYFINDGKKEIVVGCEDSLSLFRDYKKVAKEELPLYPYTITFGDLNGDGTEELVVGDWKKDSILVFNCKRTNIEKKYSLSLENNPHSVITADIEADGLDEILTITAANKFKIFNRENLIEDREAYMGKSNLEVSSLMDRGTNDILVQTGREKLSFLTHIPRLSAPTWVKKGDTFTAYTIVESDSDVQSLNNRINITNEEYLERKKLDFGYISWYKYECKANRIGRGELKMEEGPSFPVQVAGRGKREDHSHTWISDEDFSSLEIKKLFQDTPNYIKYKTGRADSGIYVSSLFTGEIPLKDARFHIEKSGRVSAEIPPLILNKTNIEVRVSNSSSRKLTAYFKGTRKIQVDSIGDNVFSLPPEDTRNVKLQLQIDLNEKKKKRIRENIRLVYVGLDTHSIFLPVNTVAINQQWVREYMDKMEDKIGRDKILTKISMSLHIPKEKLTEVFSHHNIIKKREKTT